MLEFLAEAMAKYQNKLGERGEALHELGKSLIELKRVYHESGWRLNVSEANRISTAGTRAAMLREAAGVPFTPKWHMMLHLVNDSLWKGNPQLYMQHSWTKI